MSDGNEYDDSDDYEFSDSELSISDNLDNQALMDNFKKLGKYTSSKLASGFSENEHQEGFEGLVSRLGDFYPIPILEMAVKYYRAKQRLLSKMILEAMFTEGATKITIDKKEEWVKDYELTVTVNDKRSFYGWLEEHNLGHIIKTSFVFDKSVEKETLKAFTDYLLEKQVPFDKDENVHHMTMKSQMRKLYESGEYLEAVNEGLINVTPMPVLKLKIKK